MFLRAGYMHMEDERCSWGKSRPGTLFLEEEWLLLRKWRTLLAPYKTQLRSQFARFWKNSPSTSRPSFPRSAGSPSAAPRELWAERHESRRFLTWCPPAEHGTGARPNARRAAPLLLPEGSEAPERRGRRAAANPPRGRIKRRRRHRPEAVPGGAASAAGPRRALLWEL